LVALTISLTIAVRSVALISGLKASIVASTPDSLTPKALGFKAIILTEEVNSVTAKALPEKAFFLTRNFPLSV